METAVIGSRISYDGHLCTTRWIGEVKGTKGTWLGVEWDDITRGKHAGEHDGVRYFECVQLNLGLKCVMSANQGTKAPAKAVREKYAYDESVEGLGLKPLSHHEQQTTYISGKMAEEVGFDKIRQQQANLQALRIVLVDALRINRPSARNSAQPPLPSDVQDACSKITDLDVSRNLFEQWNEVLDIARQLHSLQSLRADGLRLQSVEALLPGQVMNAAPFTRLASLTLDDTLLPWLDVVSITTHLPVLVSLSASGNEYTQLPKTASTLPKTLTTISLERNEIKAFSDLAAVLAPLPVLDSLLLKGNAISLVVSPESNGPAFHFSPLLTNLDLAFNEIPTMTFIDCLVDIFPGLTSLRTAHNPVYSNLLSATNKQPLTADDGYMLTLARLGKLRTLNYSVITDKERLNAEAYYLSQVAAELASAGPDKKQDVLKNHRRFDQLCEIYGDPTIPRAAPTSSSMNENTLAARLCNFFFVAHEAVAKKTSVSSFRMELPKSLTVYSALGLIGRQLEVEPMLLKLVWETDEPDIVKHKDEDDTPGVGSEATLGKKLSLREEVLAPRTRQLGSWIDGHEARIRVEWSEDDVKRREAQLAR